MPVLQVLELFCTIRIPEHGCNAVILISLTIINKCNYYPFPGEPLQPCGLHIQVDVGLTTKLSRVFLSMER